MKLSSQGLNLIKQFEGLRLEAYPDSAGIWTIGYGAIKYKDGSDVKKGDVISLAEAEDLLMHEVRLKVAGAKVPLFGLTQHQYDACIILAYNIGVGGFNGSTVRKLILANPKDPAIKKAFMMWNRAKDPVTKKRVVLQGLVNRRKAEADYYFS